MVSDTSRIHEAFVAGDLDSLRSAAGASSGFPDCRAPGLRAHCLEYAIYHSPYRFIQELIDLGADPSYADHDGFPSIIAALSTDREDRYRIIELLLESGADVDQRGINDWTPLHFAAAHDDVRAIELLVAKGGDLSARSRIDDRNTPLEEARMLGRARAAAALIRLSGSPEEDR